MTTHNILEMFHCILTDNMEFSDERTGEVAEPFMDTVLMVLKSRLRKA